MTNKLVSEFLESFFNLVENETFLDIDQDAIAKSDHVQLARLTTEKALNNYLIALKTQLDKILLLEFKKKKSSPALYLQQAATGTEISPTRALAHKTQGLLNAYSKLAADSESSTPDLADDPTQLAEDNPEETELEKYQAWRKNTSEFINTLGETEDENDAGYVHHDSSSVKYSALGVKKEIKINKSKEDEFIALAQDFGKCIVEQLDMMENFSQKSEKVAIPDFNFELMQVLRSKAAELQPKKKRTCVIL